MQEGNPRRNHLVALHIGARLKNGDFIDSNLESARQYKPKGQT